MNRTKLKNYAPQARRDFIQAVTDRAALYGLTSKKTEPMTEKGDVVLIAGKPFPKAVGEKRKKLEERIKKVGFEQTMEAMAYTWFNRFVAIRFMEIKGYLDHGFRVLSHPEGHSQPEILEKAQHVTLPGLDAKKVLELKLDGTKEEELYRLLLTAQCNALNKAMPFLFEKIDDETELLLPDNLLHSDSLIRKLVNEIDEEDWQEVEIIGWLYQFYISERKDEVIGKVVASEDIPAATQLFTPNWIVKYLVQNTLGRQWVASNPNSSLLKKPVDENDKHYFMEYYIEPAEQTPEVQEQLKAITPTSLNPEELTLLDPACGSGHILVEAYDLFKAIYTERGYRAKDIPALILQKNLFGLEIDDRAAQLAAFALMMKARADFSRIFDGEAKPNIVAIQDSARLNSADITHALNAPATTAGEGHVSQADIGTLISLFENGKTFGSLIQIPPKLAVKLPEIEKRLDDVLKYGDLTHASAHVLRPFLHQARLLARQYDVVVANPPYMGTAGMIPVLKDYLKVGYEEGKNDLFAAFILRSSVFANDNTGTLGLVTMHSWMFLSGFKALRQHLLGHQTLYCMAHLGPRAFDTISGEIVAVTAFIFGNIRCDNYRPVFNRLIEGGEDTKAEKLRKQASRFSGVQQNDLLSLPDSPLAYWLTESERQLFSRHPSIGTIAETRVGMATGDNNRFVRCWWEVAYDSIGLNMSREEAAQSNRRWFPYANGGADRRWYGNNWYVVDWFGDGKVLQSEKHPSGRIRAHNFNLDKIFTPGLTWSLIRSSEAGVRRLPKGFLFSSGSPALFTSDRYLQAVCGLLNSRVARYLINCMNPTINANTGDRDKVPFALESEHLASASELVEKAETLAKHDWDDGEESWDFSACWLVDHTRERLGQSVIDYIAWKTRLFDQMRLAEDSLDQNLALTYGVAERFTQETATEQPQIAVPTVLDAVRKTISYAIGCMMGRYSLDKPGLIYAHGGKQGFDPGQYKTFRADDDGIIPLLETDWGIRDDAANRFVEFIGVAWPKEHLDENLKFVADSLGPNNGEQPKDTIRRYLTTPFYKHHLSMYKKRPIYWLFSSGKQRAFQCLVYLHRYNDGTLARMRTEYVIPLMGKMNARLEHLQGPPDQKGQGGEIAATSSVTVKRRLEKERDAVKKQIAELQEFDAKLRHYADQRIKLDLDEGVKVNYGKFSDPDFGDILAEVRAVTGGSADE